MINRPIFKWINVTTGVVWITFTLPLYILEPKIYLLFKKELKHSSNIFFHVLQNKEKKKVWISLKVCKWQNLKFYISTLMLSGGRKVF